MKNKPSLKDFPRPARCEPSYKIFMEKEVLSKEIQIKPRSSSNCKLSFPMQISKTPQEPLVQYFYLIS